jgi:hypothetical protein
MGPESRLKREKTAVCSPGFCANATSIAVAGTKGLAAALCPAHTAATIGKLKTALRRAKLPSMDFSSAASVQNHNPGMLPALKCQGRHILSTQKPRAHGGRTPRRNYPHKSRVLANYAMRGYIKLERDGAGVAGQGSAADTGGSGGGDAKTVHPEPRPGRHGRLPSGRRPVRGNHSNGASRPHGSLGGESAGERLLPTRPPLHGR